ncbi:DUF116 domain-containing protein [Candidatus Desantisbacteria bacterium]|nr:DUF116 domain-containing protein [Candidatus Desantisbacteria bacterium]
MRLFINILFSTILVFIRLLRLPQDRICQWFIQTNNRLVLNNISPNLKSEHLLLLIPHCLQNYDCEFKITAQVKNCRRCGKCVIKDLINFSEKHHIRLSVAPGGTLARAIIKEYRPGLIIAVGCERELESGINDVYPLPVVGILNQKPEGPCKNTFIDIGKVEEVIRIIGKRQPTDKN